MNIKNANITVLSMFNMLNILYTVILTLISNIIETTRTYLHAYGEEGGLPQLRQNGSPSCPLHAFHAPQLSMTHHSLPENSRRSEGLKTAPWHTCEWGIRTPPAVLL